MIGVDFNVWLWLVYIGSVQELLNSAIVQDENCPLCEAPMAPNMIKLMKTTFGLTTGKVSASLI